MIDPAVEYLRAVRRGLATILCLGILIGALLSIGVALAVIASGPPKRSSAPVYVPAREPARTPNPWPKSVKVVCPYCRQQCVVYPPLGGETVIGGTK